MGRGWFGRGVFCMPMGQLVARGLFGRSCLGFERSGPSDLALGFLGQVSRIVNIQVA